MNIKEVEEIKEQLKHIRKDHGSMGVGYHLDLIEQKLIQLTTDTTEIKEEIEKIINRYDRKDGVGGFDLHGNPYELSTPKQTVIKALTTLIEKERASAKKEEAEIGQLPASPKGEMKDDILFWLDIFTRAKQEYLKTLEPKESEEK